MIIEEYLEKEVLEYCRVNKIPLINNEVPAKHVSQVNTYINMLMKKSRKETRRQENLDESRIGVILGKTMGTLKTESPIEEYMYNALVRLGLSEECKPQFEIGTKRVDFAFPKAKLVVECDGRAYHFSEQSQIERDQERDKYLARKGWRVLHFDGLMIRRNIGECIEEIKRYL